MRNRRRISVKRTLQMASAQRYMCGCGKPGCWLEVTGGWHKEHGLALGLCGADELHNISLWNSVCHKPKTARDIKMMRKADRQRRFHKTGRGRARKGPAMKSRGFNKAFKRKLDGTVVPREGR